jgi:glycosyltransferase involved in cell wall biosynthesis
MKRVDGKSITSQIRVVFLIRQLDIGGAERQLLTLVSGLPKERFEVHVVSMYDGGKLADGFAGLANVQVHSLAKQGRWDVLGFFLRAVLLLRRIQPSIIHGYMGGANEIALVLGKLLRARVVWGIRVSDLDPKNYIWSVGALFRIGRFASRWVDLLISNSERGKTFHLKNGYAPERFTVVPNGIDVHRFAPDNDDGARWRERHGIPEDAVVVVVPARLDPMKDHETFLMAMAKMVNEYRVLAICVGDGPLELRARYEARAAELGIASAVRFIDAEARVESCYRAANLIALSSSYGEGFPNVLGEAMASGTPCVSTDVGDSALILDDANRVVPPRDPDALHAAMQRVLRLPAEDRSALGRRDRLRIVANFSVERLVDRTNALLLELAANTPAREGSLDE